MPAALTLIRRTIEDHCPPGVLPSEEAANGLYGLGLMDEAEALAAEAEALAAAIVATIDQMQLRVMTKPPSPSIK